MADHNTRIDEHSTALTQHTVDLSCPLCLQPGPPEAVRGVDLRTYFRCENCLLIFVDRRHILAKEAAVTHYGTHENSLANAGYVTFLRRVVDPMLPFLTSDMRCLDFGCGPGPTLSRILAQHGIACSDYDPLFADVPLDPPYDCVFATECFEHFHVPAEDIAKIAGLIRPGGYLGVMTELWSDLVQFESWYYPRDPTHVSFFHQHTIEFISRRFGFRRLPSLDRRVLLFQRLR